MGIDKEKMWNTETNMVNTKNSLRIYNHFKTMSFMPKRNGVYCHLLQSRGVIKQATRSNIKMLSWEQIPFGQL